MCIDEVLCFLMGCTEFGEESLTTFLEETYLAIADFLNLDGDNGLVPFIFLFVEWMTDVAFLVFLLTLEIFLWVTEREGPSWTDELSPEYEDAIWEIR